MSDNDQLPSSDETLDDLADLPVSAPFPTGAHLCDMFIKRDEKKFSVYYVKFKMKQNLEMSNATETPPNPGDEAIMFIHTKKRDGSVNEFGQGQLKMILTPLSERLNTKNITELLEATVNGVEVAITSGKKKSDGYADQMTIAKLVLS